MTHQALIPTKWQLLMPRRVTKWITDIGPTCTTLYLDTRNAGKFLCGKSKMLRSRLQALIINSSSVFAVVLLLDITSSVSVCVGGSLYMNTAATAWGAGPLLYQMKPTVLSLILKPRTVKCRHPVYSTHNTCFSAAQTSDSKGFIMLTVTCINGRPAR
jgi:hypothetical protein